MDADTEEPDPGEQDDEDKRPPIEDDERADVDLDDLDVDPADVEAEAGAGADDSEDAAESDDADESTDGSDGDESGQQDAMPALDGAAESWGDQYVDMLAFLLGEIAEDGDGTAEKDAETIADLARSEPMALDDAVDEWLAESGMGQEMDPGQAVLAGTAMLVVVVIVTETDLASDLLSDL
ncbi:hypothetical protein [Halomicrobium urmianum]|uniref:hypothetical protein n=1 Tax=Halomicrobium urmianum TaxID=1586233 RepID=UPI001CD9E28D|nr:hypothetical protein [Halomicrobium urmianum]